MPRKGGQSANKAGSGCQGKGVRVPESMNAGDGRGRPMSVYERQNGCGKWVSECQENRGYPLAELALWVGGVQVVSPSA